MGHYAKVNQGIVQDVIVAEADFFDTFVDTTPGEWIQVSYNTRGGIHYQPNSNTPSENQSKALRKNYPGIGWTYDEDRDAFIPPKPFNSWTLNETTCLWDPPVDYPSDFYEESKTYDWDEDAYQSALSDSSDTSVGWVLLPE